MDYWNSLIYFLIKINHKNKTKQTVEVILNVTPPYLCVSLSDFSQPVSFENAEIGQCPNLAPPPPPPLLPDEEDESRKDKPEVKPLDPSPVSPPVSGSNNCGNTHMRTQIVLMPFLPASAHFLPVDTPVCAYFNTLIHISLALPRSVVEKSFLEKYLSCVNSVFFSEPHYLCHHYVSVAVGAQPAAPHLSQIY